MPNPNVYGATEGTWQLIPTMIKVLPPCENRTGGNWFCITHQESFANQLQKNFHIYGEQDHLFVWVCHVHGPEDPGPQQEEAKP